MKEHTRSCNGCQQFDLKMRQVDHSGMVMMLSRGQHMWSKHGYTFLAVPDLEPVVDITIYQLSYPA